MRTRSKAATRSWKPRCCRGLSWHVTWPPSRAGTRSWKPRCWSCGWGLSWQGTWRLLRPNGRSWKSRCRRCDGRRWRRAKGRSCCRCRCSVGAARGEAAPRARRAGRRSTRQWTCPRSTPPWAASREAPPRAPQPRPRSAVPRGSRRSRPSCGRPPLPGAGRRSPAASLLRGAGAASLPMICPSTPTRVEGTARRPPRRAGRGHSRRGFRGRTGLCERHSTSRRPSWQRWSLASNPRHPTCPACSLARAGHWL
mmetsp:Transcript_58995/g.188447  ORF Transcript_58995/g.188447 Transcript_58995/m.188447 type:complete len:253 (+) Transcript_58995:391-1149(+)